MTSRLRILATIFAASALFAGASSLAGCSFEPGERTQLVGQECYSDDNCVVGAVCVERRCQYETTSQRRDAGDVGPDADAGELDGGDDVDSDEGSFDMGIVDSAPVCEPGQVRCVDNTEVEFCREDASGFDTRRCEDGLRCDDGECVPVDQSVCLFQDQPCNREGESNGYYCGDVFGQTGQMRCLGICDTTVDDPDATCPEAGTSCNGESDIGLCISNCELGESCGVPGYGCLPVEDQQNDGFCAPVNPDNELGERCNGDDLFDCEAGAICVDLQNGGRCVQACRSFTGGSGTDCDDGHCVPIAATLGMCQPDIPNRTEGDQCRPRQIFQPCGDDSVVCAPVGEFQSPRCTRTCRLDEGDTDCQPRQTCIQYGQQSNGVGVCVDG